MSDNEVTLLQMEGFGRYHWEGDFPPPEVLWACQGGMTGFRAVIDPAEAPAAALEELAQSTTIETTVYRRVRYSEISDEDITTMTHVIRGAEYEAVPHGQ